MSLWLAESPETWPSAPDWISYSALVEMESCPRRWALRSASYPKVWAGSGYPAPIPAGSIEGTVVHLALEKIIRALSAGGCESPSDPGAIPVLRELGGMTAVVERCAEAALGKLQGNPRCQPVLSRLRQRLTGRVARLRLTVQEMLGRTHLSPGSKGSGGGSGIASTERFALGSGTHSEVLLEARGLGWRGYADVVNLTNQSCEIRDFKTGAPKEEHALQLRVYALLWYRDVRRNPSRRLADRLVLSYEHEDVEVSAPDEDELKELQVLLTARAEAVRRALAEMPPAARPDTADCPTCPVRQLCPEYWESLVAAMPAEGSEDGWFGDAEVRVIERHGPLSWDGVVDRGHGLRNGDRILLRVKSGQNRIEAGQTLRLLNVWLVAGNQEGPIDGTGVALATIGGSSEAYHLV